MKIAQLGWIASAGLLGFIVSIGFQTKENSIAFVDYRKVFEGSKLKDNQKAAITQAQGVWSNAVDFVRLHSVITPDQLNQMATLLQTVPLTPDSQSKLDKIESDVTSSSSLYTTLSQKGTLTPEETKTINDLTSRYQVGLNGYKQLGQAFSQRLQEFAQAQTQDATDKIRDAAVKVAKKEKVSIVFNDQAAIFGNDDLTDETIKTIDK